MFIWKLWLDTNWNDYLLSSIFLIEKIHLLTLECEPVSLVRWKVRWKVNGRRERREREDSRRKWWNVCKNLISLSSVYNLVIVFGEKREKDGKIHQKINFHLIYQRHLNYSLTRKKMIPTLFFWEKAEYLKVLSPRERHSFQISRKSTSQIYTFPEMSHILP